MVFLLFLLAAAQINAQTAAQTDELQNSVKQITDVLSIARSQAADPVNLDQALYQGAIPGMLRELDPHSVFFDPDQYQQLKHMEESEQKGFGSIVSVLPGRVIVLQAMPGSPSQKAGLSPGDEILAINGIPLNRLEFQQLVQLLTVSRQRQAGLLVRRPGNARLLQFVLDPALMDAPSVDRAFFLKAGIGYIHVASFDPKTAAQLKEAIEKLGGKNLAGLVLDLRGNPGGVVQTSILSAALFLKPGQQIMSVKGRAVKDQEVDVPKNATPYTFPLAILIDGKSASAAEIFSGAMQDHDRAVLVGELSYGKGLVQSIFPLSNSTAVALTTSFYYTPSGRSIQKPLRSGQLEFSRSPRQFRTDAGRKVTGGGGLEPDIAVQPPSLNRLRMVLDASGIFTSFATDYIQKHKITDSFAVDSSVLDEFQLYASERRIQPSLAEWLDNKPWIQSRLEQEILNQAIGVEKGDEVEEKHDPVVQAAINALGRPLPGLPSSKTALLQHEKSSAAPTRR